MNQVKDVLQGKYMYVWIQIDETTDSCGRYVTNVVASTMDASREVKFVRYESIREVLLSALVGP